MKYFFLAVVLATSLEAETEAEFIVRIKTAWESKDPDKVLALYGDPRKLDPEFLKAKRERIGLELKTLRFKSAHIVPFLPPENHVTVHEGVISSLPKDATRCISFETFSEETKRAGWTAIPIVADKEGKYSYATATKQTFAWAGSKPSEYGVTLRYGGNDGPCLDIIAVVETCGYTSWKKVGGSFSMFRAHKIHQLIVPPTTEATAMSFEISKDDKPFFKKTIDTSKGAIIPIEAPTP